MSEDLYAGRRAEAQRTLSCALAIAAASGLAMAVALEARARCLPGRRAGRRPGPLDPRRPSTRPRPPFRCPSPSPTPPQPLRPSRPPPANRPNQPPALRRGPHRRDWRRPRARAGGVHLPADTGRRAAGGADYDGAAGAGVGRSGGRVLGWLGVWAVGVSGGWCVACGVRAGASGRKGTRAQPAVLATMVLQARRGVWGFVRLGGWAVG
jgi:hypothetical protein